MIIGRSTKAFSSLIKFHYPTQLMHFNCINSFYPKTNNKILRGQVSNEKVSWDVPFPDYSPVRYTSPNILSLPPYADPDISESHFKPKWNEIDGNIKRKSYEGAYDVVDGIPRNYKGRTGVIGRGCLGRWGPNHAADPVVTRWKLDSSGNFIYDDSSAKKVLEFVSIERRDCGEWAIPGGMVDPGEKISSTLQREFMEEALNSHEMNADEKEDAKKQLQSLFGKGVEIYSGYVDDPRNTDDAWMETVAFNFHESDTDGVLYKLKLTAGDDAKAVKWTDVSSDLNLYASHKQILAKVAERLDAHW